jgi:hypothetical protein
MAFERHGRFRDLVARSPLRAMQHYRHHSSSSSSSTAAAAATAQPWQPWWPWQLRSGVEQQLRVLYKGNALRVEDY